MRIANDWFTAIGGRCRTALSGQDCARRAACAHPVLTPKFATLPRPFQSAAFSPVGLHQGPRGSRVYVDLTGLGTSSAPGCSSEDVAALLFLAGSPSAEPRRPVGADRRVAVRRAAAMPPSRGLPACSNCMQPPASTGAFAGSRPVPVPGLRQRGLAVPCRRRRDGPATCALAVASATISSRPRCTGFTSPASLSSSSATTPPARRPACSPTAVLRLRRPVSRNYRRSRSARHQQPLDGRAPNTMKLTSSIIR